MIGSNRLSASTSPRSNAVSAVWVVPTPIAEKSVGFRPALATSWLTNRWVAEPGADTPTFLPLSSAIEVMLDALRAPSTRPLFCACSTKAVRCAPFAAIWMVCS